MGMIEESKTTIQQNNYEERVKSSEAPAAKLANEHGIAGFVIGMIFLFKSSWGGPIANIHPNMFSDVGAYDRYLPFLIITLLVIIGFGISIKGISKDSSIYQKGLATAGFVINLLMIFGLGFIFYTQYFGHN